MGEGLQEIISLEGDASPPVFTPLYGTLFCSPRPTFTSGQPYLMLLDLSWHRVTRTKVCPPFMSSTLSPGLLMNITDRFTENLKMLAAGIHSPLWFSQEDNDPQRKCFLLQAFHFLQRPSFYRLCNRKWDVPP